jgi:hypothetical protein
MSFFLFCKPAKLYYCNLGSVSTLTKRIILYFQNMIFKKKLEIIIIFIIYYNILI